MKLWLYPLILILLSSAVLASTVIGPYAIVDGKNLVISGSSMPYVFDIDSKWKRCDPSLLSYQDLGDQLVFNVGSEQFVINYTYTTKDKVKIKDKNSDYVKFKVDLKGCGFYYTQNFTDKKSKLSKDDDVDYLEYEFSDEYVVDGNKIKKGNLELDLTQAVVEQGITILYNSTTKKLKLSGDKIKELDPDLTVSTSQTLCGVQTYDDVIINNSAKVTVCAYNGTDPSGTLIFNGMTFNISFGSLIDGAGKGFRGGAAQIDGEGTGGGGGSTNYGGGGAGYGGTGGNGGCTVDYGIGGISYGSTTNVSSMGSGGGGGSSNTGSAGGAYVFINMSSFVSVFGNINVSGTIPPYDFYTGGAGSGGGLKISTKVIFGNGTLISNGGSSSGSICSGGGGAGGRILINYCLNQSSYKSSVIGGTGANSGGVGSYTTSISSSCMNPNFNNSDNFIINSDATRFFQGRKWVNNLILFSDSVSRSITFANVTFTYSFTPANPIPYNSSGYDFSFNWNTSGGSLDKYYVNLTYANGTNILQSTSFNISLANYTLGNYYLILWANISNGVVSEQTEAWSVTDQYLPTYHNLTLSSSPYYNGYNLNIYINTTDAETNVSSVKVNLRDQNNVNYLNVGGGGVLSGGLWGVTYAPAVNGIWTIYSIEIRDAYNNLVNETPGTTFNVVPYVAPLPPNGVGGSVNPPLVSGTNLTFSLTPTQTDVIVIKGDETIVPIKISSTSPGVNNFRVLINDQCGVFKNISTTKAKSSDYYSLGAFEDLVFKFRLVFPSDFNKDDCKVTITFEGSNSFSRSTTINLINTPIGYLLKRVVTILYYPLAFDDQATKIEFLTPTTFAVFPAAKSLTIPFFGTLIIVLFFFVIRFMLFVAFRSLRTNKRMLFIISSALIIIPIALMYKSFNFSILATNVWIGIGFILVVVAIIAGTFRLPRFSPKK